MCKSRGTGKFIESLTSTSKATGELGILAESNNEHALLVLHGMVNGVHVSCLVDSGATHNFFSSDLIAKAGCQPRVSRTVCVSTWRMEERRCLRGSGARATICLCFPAFRDNVAGVVTPISKYDVILGKPWLYKHNPKIDFRNNNVGFNDADQDTGAAEPAVRGLAPTGGNEGRIDCAAGESR